jgi:hypothetical protein
LIVIIRSLFAGVATIPDIAANFNLSAEINGELVDEPLKILRERAFCSREKNLGRVSREVGHASRRTTEG